MVSAAEHDARNLETPVDFSAWCFEHGRRYIGCKDYEDTAEG
jgi:hypothetical protein